MRVRNSLPFAICVLALTLGDGPAPFTESAVGQTNNQVQPASPSGTVRPVLKVSSEGAGDVGTSLAELRKRRPDLQGLVEHLQSNPADVEAIVALAGACLEEKLYLAAYDLFQELQVRAPGDARTHIGLVSIWKAWGDTGLALQHASRATTLDAGSAEALETLGWIHLHRGETEPALASLVRALALRPEDPALLAGVGYVHMLRTEWQEARRCLERAVEIDGSLDVARNNLGVVLARLGDREGALRQFTAASGPAAAHNNLGVAYLGAGNWKEAREEFRLALAINPEYAKARSNLAEAESHLPPPAAAELKAESGSRAISEDQDGAESAGAHPGNRDGIRSAVTAAGVDEPHRHSHPLPSAGDERRDVRGEIVPSPRDPPDPPETGSQPREIKPNSLNPAYAVQFYASKTEESARAAGEALAIEAGFSPVIERADSQATGTWYRAKLPGFKTYADALRTARRLAKAGFIKDYWIVPPGH